MKIIISERGLETELADTEVISTLLTYSIKLSKGVGLNMVDMKSIIDVIERSVDNEV